MQIVWYGDNLHKLSCCFQGKIKKNVISLLSAEFANSVLSVNSISLKFSVIFMPDFNFHSDKSRSHTCVINTVADGSESRKMGEGWGQGKWIRDGGGLRAQLFKASLA